MKKYLIVGVIAFILGSIIFGGVTGVAAYTMFANSIAYTPKNSNWEVDTVEDALNSLYLSKTSENYSTEEKKVGTWIDGKPIYQRSFVVTESVSLDGGSDTSIGLPGFSSVYVSEILPTMDAMIDADVNYYDAESTNTFKFAKGISIIKSNGYIASYDNPGVEYIGYHVLKDSVITIKYTKTTD